MTKTNHKPGVHENYLVTRKLSIKETCNVDLLMNNLSEVIGLDEAVYDCEKCKLTVSYDASVLSIDRVIDIIREIDSDVINSWWGRFVIGWYRFSDQNVHDNAEHKPFCCNKVPPKH